MRKILYFILALGVLCVPAIKSQNLDDAIRFNKRELTGTSRSLGMANAFGALGGDLSAISINPAGIAVYRTSEFAFTPSISLNQNTSRYGSFKSTNDKYSFPFNQIGGIATNRPLREKEKGLISTHFGFSYNRTADFNNSINMMMRQNVVDEYDENGNPYYDGNNNPILNTLLSNILFDAQGYTPQTMNDRAFFAYKNYLIEPLYVDAVEYFSQYEVVEDIDENNSIYYNRNLQGVNQKFLIDNSGYSGEYALTFGANVSNVLMLGVSLNFQSFKFEQKKTFREINSNGFTPAHNQNENYFFTYKSDLDYFDTYERLNQDGFGMNGKLGLILNLNPFRFGASFHTPTFYTIDEEFQTGIETFYLNYDRFHEKSDLGTFSYNYRTPYRAQGSFAFVLGKFALLSLDYEMTDHTSSHISSKDGYNSDFETLNTLIKEQFKMAHDIKAGIEIRPVPFFAIRAGAAYYDSPFKKEYTNTDMSKWMATTGLGIRNKNFFFDIAYAYTMHDDSYFLSTENTIWHGVYFDEPIELKYRRHQASFTFGWKF